MNWSPWRWCAEFAIAWVILIALPLFLIVVLA